MGTAALVVYYAAYKTSRIMSLRADVTQSQYRAAVRARADITFICPPCKDEAMRMAADDAAANADGSQASYVSIGEPRFESTRHSALHAPDARDMETDGAQDEDAANDDAPLLDDVDEDPEVIGSFDLDVSGDMDQPDDQSLFVAGVADDDGDVVADDDDEPPFRVMKGASQRGKDLLVERIGYAYNVSKT